MSTVQLAFTTVLTQAVIPGEDKESRSDSSQGRTLYTQLYSYILCGYSITCGLYELQPVFILKW